MAKTTDPNFFLSLFNFCSWFVSSICRFGTSLFSPAINSKTYYQTCFGLHVSAVTYVVGIVMVVFAVISAVISATTGEFIALLIGLINMAFSVSLLYGSCKRKAPFYLPSLVFFHVFLYCGLIYTTFRMITLIWGVSKFERGGWKSSPDTMIENMASIFYCQLKLAVLCIFGVIINVLYRDYMFAKSMSKSTAAIEPNLTPSTISKELENKEQNGGVSHLYV